MSLETKTTGKTNRTDSRCTSMFIDPGDYGMLFGSFKQTVSIKELPCPHFYCPAPPSHKNSYLHMLPSKTVQYSNKTA